MKSLIICALIVALVWLGTEYAILQRKTEHYAAVIAAAANGGQFAISEGWLVSCKGKRIPVYF